MPPQGRPTSSHSSRPMSSHSSSGSHGGMHHSSPSHHGGFHHSPPPHHGGFHHSPPPPHHYGHRPPRPYHSSGGYRGPSDYRYGGNSCLGGCITLFSILALLVFIVLAVRWAMHRNDNKPDQQPASGYSQSIEQHDPIYVTALGRDVEWSKKYNCYYDKETECYFFLNTKMNPEIWQYWYEGTSNNYGKYGWMEWDPRENKWFVQTGNKKWEVLPEDQIQPHFWHFD